jgi:hypothetical protein
VLGCTIGQAVADPAKPIVPMIERFMATDQALVKARRGVNQSSAETPAISG